MNDADMLGTCLADYAKNVVTEVVALGRAGTPMDWEGVPYVIPHECMRLGWDHLGSCWRVFPPPAEK